MASYLAVGFTPAIQGPTATNLKSTAVAVPTYQYVPVQSVAVAVPVAVPVATAAVCYPCVEVKETKTVGLAGVMFSGVVAYQK